MLLILYQCLLILAYPAVRARLAWRAWREPEYGERVAERFGHIGADLPRGAVWFHTVSAGETIAAAPLIRALAEEFSNLPFLVTTTTPAGSHEARQRLADCTAHCYAPYDFRPGVERFFACLEPRVLVLMETELWPNLIDAAHRRGIPVVLVNARLSARSARGYARVGSVTRDMLRKVAIIACQHPDHAKRFVDLGAEANQVVALGNIKFDIGLAPDFATQVADLRERWALAGRRVWVAGSTHSGEEVAVIEAHRLLCQTYPDACLLLVPRHPSRADSVEKLVVNAGLSVVRQSAANSDSVRECCVLLCDTMGQLQNLYGLSDVAFLGGSLVPVGGHNPIEAAVCGQPLIVGPATFNFTHVVAAFAQAGCLFVVADAQAMAAQLKALLGDDVERVRLGAAALAVVADNKGASAHLLALLGTQVRQIGGSQARR